MGVRCALVGLDEDFRNDTGLGAERYGYELYNNLRKIGAEVGKVSYGTRAQYVSHMATDNFSSYDVVHMPNFRLFYPLRRGKAATLVTAHDFQPLVAPELNMGHDATPQNRLFFELVKLGLRRTLKADYMICNSTLTRDDAVRLGYDRGRTFVAPHGIDDRFRAPRKAVKRRGKTFKVGYLGAFRARKNVASAIEAFKEIDDPNFAFELWGKKAFEYDHLTEIAKGDRRIRFMGFAPEGRIVDIYDSFDAFVFPSLYEGEGLPILEAQARGLPVVVHKKAKIPKEVRKYCLEVRDYDHMAQALSRLSRDGYGGELKNKAASYAQSFTWRKLATETLAVYKNISN